MTKSIHHRKISIKRNNAHQVTRKIGYRQRQIHHSITRTPCQSRNSPYFPPILLSTSPLLFSTTDGLIIPIFNSHLTCDYSHLPLARHPLIPHHSYQHSLGPCDIICQYCDALHWIQERSYRSTTNDPLFFNCCQRGQINLPVFPEAPEPMKSLLQDNTDGVLSFIHPESIN